MSYDLELCGLVTPTSLSKGPTVQGLWGLDLKFSTELESYWSEWFLILMDL